jgi:hypothetical protein
MTLYGSDGALGLKPSKTKRNAPAVGMRRAAANHALLRSGVGSAVTHWKGPPKIGAVVVVRADDLLEQRVGP